MGTNGEFKVSLFISTSGDGLWSNKKQQVKVTNIFINAGEEILLRTYFDPDTWNINKHGLIYTDKGFLQGLRADAKRLAEVGRLPGYNWNDLNYTEQGMQGDDYVSLILSRW